jgi:hypothetical protein
MRAVVINAVKWENFHVLAHSKPITLANMQNFSQAIINFSLLMGCPVRFSPQQIRSFTATDPSHINADTSSPLPLETKSQMSKEI